MKRFHSVVFTTLLVACGQSEPEGPKADLLLINGNVLTVDADRPQVAARGIRRTACRR